MRIYKFIFLLLIPLKIFSQQNPFEDMDYDTVVAYEFDGSGLRMIDYVLEYQSEKIDQKKTLTSEEVATFENIITSKGAYGQATAACFDPHLAVVYYKEGEIVAQVDVCLQCNSLIASEEIPAKSEIKVDIGTPSESSLTGLSKSSRKRLDKFLQEIDFNKYRHEMDSVFD